MWSVGAHHLASPFFMCKLLNRCCSFSAQVGEAEKELGGATGTNPFAQLVDEAEGLDKIEDLQVGWGRVVWWWLCGAEHTEVSKWSGANGPVLALTW